MTIYPCFPGGKLKAFTLSYDDGVVQDIRFIEMLNKYGLKCTFNLNSDLLDTEQRILTLEEAKKLYKGHEVAIHALQHPFLNKIPLEHATYCIAKDRENLENMFGGSIRGCAYPFGTTNDDVVTALKCCGIKYARTTKTTENFNLPQEWLRWEPTCHHKNPNLMSICDTFVNTPNLPHRTQLFSVWGHTYEFDNDNNWDMIEEFLKAVSGHDNIWYATNIEIYDYLAAYNSLITSYNLKYIHNPTATTIYFALKYDQYCIKPGETIEF